MGHLGDQIRTLHSRVVSIEDPDGELDGVAASADLLESSRHELIAQLRDETRRVAELQAEVKTLNRHVELLRKERDRYDEKLQETQELVQLFHETSQEFKGVDENSFTAWRIAAQRLQNVTGGRAGITTDWARDNG